MAEPQDTIQSTGENISRRELLKVLTATGGGLLAAAFIPGKWLKPVIEAGVLPAHAQTSLCETGAPGVLQLSNLNIFCEGYDDKMGKYYYSGNITYSDSCCEVNIEEPEGVIWTDNHSANQDDYAFRDGSNECQGKVDFTFWASPPTWLHGYLIVNGRQSNTVTAHLDSC